MTDVHARIRRLKSHLNLPGDSAQADSHLLSEELKAFSAIIKAVQIHRGHLGLERLAQVVNDDLFDFTLGRLLVFFFIHGEVAADKCAILVKIVFVEQNLPL